MLSFALVDESKGEINVTETDGKYILEYPCPNSWDCTPYKTTLSPGTYHIELYGASGGSEYPTQPFRYENNSFLSDDIVNFYHGNAKVKNFSSMGGSGGYTAGLLIVPKTTEFFIRIGGQGQKKRTNSDVIDYCENSANRPQGGYNGGGMGTNLIYQDTFGGGGATDIRAQKDDVFHRVIVAGAGGGSDNFNSQNLSIKYDDGTGGSGGNLTAQGFFVAGNLKSEKVAKQVSGFSFGYGESANWNGCATSCNCDRAGAGAGWFGGYSSGNTQGGGGGGSSFALTINAKFPRGIIDVYDSENKKIESDFYAFRNHEYLVTNPVFEAGIWSGNGRAIITHYSFNSIIPLNKIVTCNHKYNRMFHVCVQISLIYS